MTTITFGPWRIERSEWLPEWEAVHRDYDASWEGEEDGWVSNGLHVTAKTIPDLLDEIEEYERWKDMPLTPRDLSDDGRVCLRPA